MTLKNYMDNKRIPRGLRIVIFPTFDDLEDDQLKEWEDNLYSASFCMMNILIKNTERKVDKLKKQIVELEKEISEMKLPELTEQNYNILKDVISKHQTQIKERKLSKIRRDESDYNSGRIFTFSKNFNEVNKFKQSHLSEDRANLSLVHYSSSDLSSVDESGPKPTECSSFSEEIQRMKLGNRKNITKQGGVGEKTDNIRMGTRSQDKKN